MVKKSIFVMSLVVTGMAYESSAQADPKKQTTLFDYYSLKASDQGPKAPKKNPSLKVLAENNAPPVVAPRGKLTRKQRANVKYIEACQNKWY